MKLNWIKFEDNSGFRLDTPIGIIEIMNRYGVVYVTNDGCSLFNRYSEDAAKKAVETHLLAAYEKLGEILVSAGALTAPKSDLESRVAALEDEVKACKVMKGRLWDPDYGHITYSW